MVEGCCCLSMDLNPFSLSSSCFAVFVHHSNNFPCSLFILQSPFSSPTLYPSKKSSSTLGVENLVQGHRIKFALVMLPLLLFCTEARTFSVLDSSRRHLFLVGGGSRCICYLFHGVGYIFGFFIAAVVAAEPMSQEGALECVAILLVAARAPACRQ